MMKTHSSGRLRMLGGGAAIALLAGASLALGAPSFAQPGAPAPEAKQDQAAPREERREEHVIIRTHRVGEGEHREHREQSARGDAGHRDHGHQDRRVIVVTRPGGDGGHGAHNGDGERPVHRFDMYLPHGGHGGHGVLATAACGDGERSEVNEGDERTRVIVCSRGTASPAERIERLQRVRDRLAEDGELSAEQRGRVTAALDREIARLRGQ